MLLAGLSVVQPATNRMTARDIYGRSWSLLAPAAGQFDLLFFLSTDCPISNRYAPEIERMCREYGPRGVRCFAVYPDAVEAGVVRRHRRDFGFPDTIPAIIDRDHAMVRAVAPRVTPEAAIYAPRGRLYRGRIDDLYVDVGRSRREPTRHDVRWALDAALAGRPVSMSETEAIGCAIPQS